MIPAEIQVSPGLVARQTYSTDSVSALRNLTVKNLYQGYLINFYYFLLDNFTIMILWLWREHDVFCFARLLFHIIPTSETETASSTWDTGKITKKANNLRQYGEIWKVSMSEEGILAKK